MDDLISVIVPVYNVEKYLRRSLESVINQTYKNLEIIIVDDGSTDNSGKICDEYKEKDSRISVIHKQNAGQGAARNIGLDTCSGKYVYFHDSDDWMDDDCIESLHNQLVLNDVDISVCNYRYINEDGKDCGLFSDDLGKHIYNGYEVIAHMWNDEIINIAPWAKLYSISVWKGFRYKECYSEDSATMYMLYKPDMKISYDGRALVNYLVRSDSDVRSFSKKKLYLIEIYEDIVKYAEKNMPNKLQKAAKSKQIAVNFHLLSQMPHGKYKKIRGKIKQTIKENRKLVLFDKSARIKNRIACALSYIGIDFAVVLFRLIKKYRKGCI